MVCSGHLHFLEMEQAELDEKFMCMALDEGRMVITKMIFIIS
jgi:tRNA-specific adenosine deaminase 2